MNEAFTEPHAQAAEQSPPAKPSMPPGFVMKARGIYRKSEDPEKPDLFVCGPLVVEASTNNGNGDAWGALLTWTDKDGRPHEMVMPYSLLAGDGVEVRKRLLDGGLMISTDRRAHAALAEYLQCCSPSARVLVVPRLGWHETAAGLVFVLPHRSIGSSGNTRYMLQSERSAAIPQMTERGTLAQWRAEVADKCLGNSRLMLALSAAFAASTLHLLGAEGGGLHLRGNSSTGKSTALDVAGSVWGGGGIKGWSRSWRATDNALEATAAAHNSLLLCLDEMGEASAEAVSAAAYMLANGVGKGRASRDAAARPSLEWQLLFLSSGEVGVADHLAEAKGGPRRARAGQEVRVVNIPADAGVGLGIFEDCHGMEPKDFSNYMKDAARQYYGTAGQVFIEELVADASKCRDILTEERADFVRRYTPKGASGQVGRVLDRFGIIAAAGELAADLGILPWPAGEASKAAAACFQAWLDDRDGGAGSFEAASVIRMVQHFVSAHDSRFVRLDQNNLSEPQQREVINRAGWKKRYHDGWRYLILPEVFRREVIPGMDPRAAATALSNSGFLLSEGEGRPQRKERVPGHENPLRVYVIRAAIMEGEDYP